MEEEEIDLRDYIRMVRREWKIILAVPLVACIVSAVISFRLPKIYSASSLLGILETVVTVEGGGIQRFGLKADFYKTLATDGRVAQEIIEKLRLNQPPDDLTVGGLIGMVSVKVEPEASILKITVEANSPGRAKAIADAMAEKMVEINRDLLSAQAGKSKGFFGDQVRGAKAKMEKAEEELLSFRKKANLSVLRQRVNNLLTQRGEFEVQFGDLVAKIETEETALREVSRHFESQEKTFKLSKSLSDDPVFREMMAKIIGKDLTGPPGLKMESEEVDPLYQSLQKQLTDTTINLSVLKKGKSVLEKRITENEIELSRLQKELDDKEAELTRLERAVNISREEYLVFARKEALSKTMGAVSVGDIVLIARAVEPSKPIKPRKKQNVLISGILGLMVGFGCGAFTEYIKKT